MAAAIRSMLGKSGNRISSVANMVAMGDTEIRTLNLGYSSRHPLESYFPTVYHPRNIRRPKKLDLNPSIPDIYYGAGPIHDSPRDSPRVVINAHFSLEEFNKQKNAQLQFVRVVKAYNQECCFIFNHQMLTLEAIDADNVIRIYQAIVKQYSTGIPLLKLLLFGLVADDGNGSLLKLIDNRGAGRQGPTDNRRVGEKIIKVQRTERYSLEEEILSNLALANDF